LSIDDQLRALQVRLQLGIFTLEAGQFRGLGIRLAAALLRGQAGQLPSLPLPPPRAQV